MTAPQWVIGPPGCILGTRRDADLENSAAGSACARRARFSEGCQQRPSIREAAGLEIRNNTALQGRGGQMKTDFLRKLACAACVAVAALTGSAALAQEIQLASTSEMSNIYARLAELESRVASSNIATKGDGLVDECCD